MPIEIIVPRWKSETHAHFCVFCKKVREEPNDICRKTSGSHKYPCLFCLPDYRRRFGSFSDEILGAYLSDSEISRIREVTPDQISDLLDARDKEIARQQLEKLAERAQAAPPVKPQEKVQENHEAFDKLMDEADKLSYDEVKAEIEKTEREEKFS